MLNTPSNIVINFYTVCWKWLLTHLHLCIPFRSESEEAKSNGHACIPETSKFEQPIKINLYHVCRLSKG